MFFLYNIPFWCLCIAGIWAYADRKYPLSKNVAYLLLLLPGGIGEIWWFVFEFFFSSQIAEFQGWQSSHFAQQIAFFDLGIGITSIIAYFRKDYLFTLAAGTMVSLFLGLIALHHIISFIVEQNIAIAHSGFTFSTDLITSIGLMMSLHYWKGR